jgi:hypothetical protein
MTEKRLTPAELRQQQEERERLAEEAQAKAREDAAEKVRQAERAAARALADKSKATWYQSVATAAQHNGVRFVALAKVIGRGGEHAALVTEIIAEIKAGGYRASVASLSGVVLDGREQEIRRGVVKGMVFENPPQFGTNGELNWLIVEW